MHSLTDITLPISTTTIRTAMRSIDQGSLRICLLVNDNGQLLGTVTDGDIRRALLRDANMHDMARLIMNSTPVWAKEGSSREQCLEIMKEHDLLALPIVDANNVVVAVATLRQAMTPEKLSNPVFIMAGGFGTRLQPLTEHCPKPMLPVGGKPMLEHLINQFISVGFHNFYISTHYLPDVISNYFKDGSNWNANIQYVHETTPLGTGGALGLLPKNLPDIPLIMMNGDVLTKLNYAQLLRHHIDKGFDATVCVREDEHRIPFGVIETENQLITSVVEKPTFRYKINTGIYVLNSNIVNSVPLGQRIDLPVLLEENRKNNKRIGTYTSYDYWLDIGQMKDYQKAQVDIESFF